MKALLWLIAVLLTMLGPAKSHGKSSWQRFQATAYSVEGETASGKQTREGRTIAADPKILPLGTKVEIKGAGAYDGVYVVHDAGRTVKGREVDIFIDAPAEAKKFGRKPVQLRILGQSAAK